MLDKSQWQNYKLIIAIALVIRIIAVIFSPGYGMHDDHFLVIEASASWANGSDYNYWLPWSPENSGNPKGHSFTYVGLNFLYFYIMKFFGIVNPMVLMFFNRLLHALFSMLIVVYGIKITEKLSNVKNAKTVGWFLALLWIMPFLAVRNLVETAALPFLIIGFWILLRNRSNRDFLYAGLIIGVAISFRFQIGVFAIGLAAVYFFRYQWKAFFLFCSGILLMFIITQGLVDYLIWGYPFAEFIAYVTYNLNEGKEYLKNENYFMYILVLMGLMLFPMGILLFIGFLKSWKKYILLFIPVLLFILFHTFYPNRQERFILSIFPFFIILGVLGYDLIKESSLKFKIWRISIIAFWVLNIPLLFFASTMYTKKSRVESMYALYNVYAKEEVILMEGSATGRISMLPLFYSGNWNMNMTERTDPNSPLKLAENIEYDYIFFFDEKQLTERIDLYRKIYPNMHLFKKCDPSFLDKLLRYLNPKNKNEYIEVWKTENKKATIYKELIK